MSGRIHFHSFLFIGCLKTRMPCQDIPKTYISGPAESSSIPCCSGKGNRRARERAEANSAASQGELQGEAAQDAEGLGGAAEGEAGGQE